MNKVKYFAYLPTQSKNDGPEKEVSKVTFIIEKY
jgi:hypothetical protein